MEAKELRLGNLIKDGHDIESVTLDHLYMLIQDKAEFDPIPLTEEWLVKLGFTEKHQTFQFNGFQIDGTVVHFSYDKWRSNYDVESCDFVEIPQEIKHVHQLQNLYFALTGEELTVKNA